MPESNAGKQETVTASSTSLSTTPDTVHYSLECESLTPENEVLSATFSQQIDVLGIVQLFGEEQTPCAKLRHAAIIFAQWIDNDEDGIPDDPAVAQQLVASNVAIPVVAELALYEALTTLVDNGYFTCAGLQADQVHPGGSQGDIFDATLEETLHVYHCEGLAMVYPELLGVEAGSQLAEAMDLARGGHFTEIPDQYPDEGWYHYDDHTCEYGCMVAEYFYWALTTSLGGQDYSESRCQEIAIEWEVCSAATLKETDVAITALLTDSRLTLPRTLPDGEYRPSN